jgi:hypothetical protein
VAILFDYDADSGMKTWYDYDPVKDQALLSYEQDVSFFLDRMKAIRDNADISAKGMAEDWWLYASIPPVVEMELKKKGLDLNNKDHMKAILREINANFPFLKATEKTHA